MLTALQPLPPYIPLWHVPHPWQLFSMLSWFSLCPLALMFSVWPQPVPLGRYSCFGSVLQFSANLPYWVEDYISLVTLWSASKGGNTCGVWLLSFICSSIKLESQKRCSQHCNPWNPGICFCCVSFMFSSWQHSFLILGCGSCHLLVKKAARQGKLDTVVTTHTLIGLKIEYPWIIHFSLILYSNWINMINIKPLN